MRYVCRWEWDEHDDGELGESFDNPEDAAEAFLDTRFHDISYHGKPLHVVARDEMGADFHFKVTVDWDPMFYIEAEMPKERP